MKHNGILILRPENGHFTLRDFAGECWGKSGTAIGLALHGRDNLGCEVRDAQCVIFRTVKEQSDFNAKLDVSAGDYCRLREVKS